MSDEERNAPSPAEVERQIDHTRVELALTMDAIERKLNARYLVEKGVEMFRDTFNGGDALNRSVGVIRANPVPFALFGIGAAWLIASNTGLAQDERVRRAGRRVADLASDVGNRAGGLASNVAGRVGMGSSTEQPLGYTGNPMLDETGQPKSDGWVHQVSGMAQGALRSVRDSSGAMMQRAGVYAGDGASRVADRMTDTFHRHPLVIGAIGVMAGALVAALLPLTRTEEEWFGGARDDVWRKVEDVGQQAVTRVRDAATHAATRAVDAAADAAANAASETLKEEIGRPSQR